MDRIAIAGLSLHRTDVSGLESIRRPDASGTSAYLRDLSDALGASELVLLATCNRVEVVYAREEGELPGEADLPALASALSVRPDDAGALAESLMLRTGRDAFHHLFRVSSSLDSLVVGEDQIIAQVRGAYGRSSDIGLVGPLLSPLFHAALQIGKKVRSDTDLARHPVSVVNLAVARLAGRADEQPSLAVLGAGEMGALLGRALSAAGLPPSVIANRTRERAVALASDCHCAATSLDDFVSGTVPVDVIVSATSAPGVVLDAERLSALAAGAPAGRGLLAIDLAVPRDIAPCDDPAVSVVCLDDLRAEADSNRALRAEAAAVAEQLVEAKLGRFCQRFHEERAAPAVATLREDGAEILERELSGLLGGRLSHLGETDRRAVERWARATFGRLMHLPVAALKRMAADDNGHDLTERPS
jgi:glutamyl-tRNA reductase